MRRTPMLPLAALLAAALLAACAAPGARPAPEAAAGRPYLADGDAHGYLSYDPTARVLRGFTRDGAQKWQRNDIDPYEAHCVRACPDAVVSTRPKGPGGTGGEVLWMLGGARPTPPAEPTGVTVHWALSPTEWVGSTTGSIVVESGGRRRETPLENGSTVVFRGSPDGTRGIVSNPAGTGPDVWVGHQVSLDAKEPAVGGATPAMPGPAGCWTDDGTRIVTLGKGASAFARDNPGTAPAGLAVDFVSECSAGPFGIAVVDYRPSPSGNTAKVSVFDPVTFRAMGSSGYLPQATGFRATGACVAFSRDGKLTFMNPADGTLHATRNPALDIWPAGGGAAYVLEKANRARVVPVSSRDCPAAG
ncbi:hypothetical protein GCM10018781_07040 [Kitasatospora indigofera]|uniref:Lipoprotein n=1 Tax=Kitasatospora indigofera TaxID=67307 RepID=A0A919FD94_9ACTN|nr:hypothetical protein [Kitasatospora indigofera]GHH61135.1 hypothetical protein GCM10018781_07040 [Kitasatospora indigofera]